MEAWQRLFVPGVTLKGPRSSFRVVVFLLLLLVLGVEYFFKGNKNVPNRIKNISKQILLQIKQKTF